MLITLFLMIVVTIVGFWAGRRYHFTALHTPSVNQVRPARLLTRFADWFLNLRYRQFTLGVGAALAVVFLIIILHHIGLIGILIAGVIIFCLVRGGFSVVGWIIRKILWIFVIIFVIRILLAVVI